MHTNKTSVSPYLELDKTALFTLPKAGLNANASPVQFLPSIEFTSLAIKIIVAKLRINRYQSFL
jgi:hypothetical protein